VSPIGRFGLPDILKADSDHEARKRFLGFMDQALHLVRGDAHWIVGRQAVGDFWWARLNPEEVLLPGAETIPIFLSATIEFTHQDDARPERRRERKVATRKYIFTISGPEASATLFEWHWHPTTSPERRDPHIHVTGTNALGALDRLHIPSWRVWFEDVLLFAIEDLEIPCRDGAAEVLRDNRDRARRWASWGSGPSHDVI
jgi:hypothetical protein